MDKKFLNHNLKVISFIAVTAFVFTFLGVALSITEAAPMENIHYIQPGDKANALKNRANEIIASVRTRVVAKTKPHSTNTTARVSDTSTVTATATVNSDVPETATAPIPEISETNNVAQLPPVNSDPVPVPTIPDPQPAPAPQPQEVQWDQVKGDIQIPDQYSDSYDLIMRYITDLAIQRNWIFDKKQQKIISAYFQDFVKHHDKKHKDSDSDNS
jgi:hypothetical protein